MGMGMEMLPWRDFRGGRGRCSCAVLERHCGAPWLRCPPRRRGLRRLSSPASVSS